MDELLEVWMPTLQELTLIRTSTILWNTKNLRKLAIKLSENPSSVKSDDYLDVVEETISKLSTRTQLPIPIKLDLDKFLKIIGDQIIKWINYHFYRLKLVSERQLPKRFVFSQQGILDKTAIANELVRQKSIALRNRYKIACIYCLEDHIGSLFRNLDVTKAGKLFITRLGNANGRTEPILCILWTRIWEGIRRSNRYTLVLNIWNNPHFNYTLKDAILGSIFSGNEVALKYFVKLYLPLSGSRGLSDLVDLAIRLLPLNVYNSSEVIRELEKSRLGFSITPELNSFDSFITSARLLIKQYEVTVNALNEDSSHIFCSILTSIPGNQLRKFISAFPKYALRCLLEWPYIRSFVKVVEQLWRDNTHQEKFAMLSSFLELDLMDSLYIFNYLWQLIPLDVRKYKNLNIPKNFFISLLIKTERLDLFLQNASEEDREDLIFCKGSISACHELIVLNNFSAVKLLIEECLVYSDMLVKFKDRITRHIMLNLSKTRNKLTNDSTYNEFFEFLGQLSLKERKIDYRLQSKRQRTQ